VDRAVADCLRRGLEPEDAERLRERVVERFESHWRAGGPLRGQRPLTRQDVETSGATEGRVIVGPSPRLADLRNGSYMPVFWIDEIRDLEPFLDLWPALEPRISGPAFMAVDDLYDPLARDELRGDVLAGRVAGIRLRAASDERHLPRKGGSSVRKRRPRRRGRPRLPPRGRSRVGVRSSGDRRRGHRPGRRPGSRDASRLAEDPAHRGLTIELQAGRVRSYRGCATLGR